MPAETAKDGDRRATLKPFVLKWAEDAPARMLWSPDAVFSAPVHGLDSAIVSEPDQIESTGGPDTQDCTHT
jgi:hypothetical protein